MESIAQSQATLVDLLDRVLDRGLILNADIIISLAGVPLVGINLRAALAGMETMLKHGLMQEWDQNIRVQEMERRRPSLTFPASQGEAVAGVASEIPVASDQRW